MGSLVYHQIIRFGEASLAKFAHKFTLWSHLTAEIRPTIVIINSHYRKHFVEVKKLVIFFGYFTHYLALSRAFFVVLSRYTHYKSTEIMYVSEYILRFCSFSAIPLECIYIQFLSFARCRCRDSVDERKVKKGVKIVCFYLNCFNLFF